MEITMKGDYDIIEIKKDNIKTACRGSRPVRGNKRYKSAFGGVRGGTGETVKFLMPRMILF